MQEEERSANQRNHPRFIAGIGLLANPTSQTGSANSPEKVRLLRNVWIELDGGKIKQIGPEGESFPPVSNVDNCPRYQPNQSDAQIFDAAGRLATPGFIDAHTHPAFVSFRQQEFIRRCQGQTYLEIAAAGGGILSSVRAVRAASKEELTRLIRGRLRRFLELGVTTVEAKSGYGLSTADELKSLEAIRDAAAAVVPTAVGTTPSSAGRPTTVGPTDCPTVSATLLGAHTVPPEYKSNPDRYVEIVCKEMIPAAAEAGLAESVDVFVEESAFSLAQARRVFEAGKKAGLGLRIHADQFTTSGGARLAAEFKALTADHMDRTPENELRLLAEAGVTIVLLPGAVFFLGLNEYAPARRMIEADCRVALSTDFNPGTSPTQSLPLMMTLACNRMKMTPAEALWSVTMGGAYALGRQDRIGSLAEGYQADICLWDAEDVDYLPYAFGDQIPAAVFKSGKLVAERGRLVGE